MKLKCDDFLVPKPSLFSIMSKTDKKVAKKDKKKSKVSKAQAKLTKAKIHKLNANINEINEIQLLLGTNTSKETKVLDVKTLRADLKKDEEDKSTKKELDNDLTKQLELLTGMGL